MDDNWCWDYDVASVNDIGGPTITTQSWDLACGGDMDGSAMVSIIGSNGSYTVMWSTGDTTETITGLSGGAYGIEVTDSAGCKSADAVGVMEPDTLMIWTMEWDVTCNGDDDAYAEVMLVGGTAPFWYNWSTGDTTDIISGLSSGSYAVTVTDDNNCWEIDSAIITEPLVIAPKLTGTDVTCKGDNDGTAVSTPDGGTSPYWYNWSTGDTTSDLSSLSAGTYTLTVTDDDNCWVEASVVVSEPAAVLSVLASATNETSASANDGTASAVANGGTPTYSYKWSNGGGGSQITGLDAGMYTATVTDANGCRDFASTEVKTDAVGIPDISGGIFSRVYPNPTSGNLTVEVSLDKSQLLNITIYNVIGEKITDISDARTLGGTYEIDLSDQPDGFYFIRLRTENGVLTQKVTLARRR